MTTIEQTKEQGPPFDDTPEGHRQAIAWAEEGTQQYWEELVAWNVSEPEQNSGPHSEINETLALTAVRWVVENNPTAFSLDERARIQRIFPKIRARGVMLAYSGTESIADIPETVLPHTHDPLAYGV